MDRKEPDGPWHVICPSKTGRSGDVDTVAEWVCEADAKAIADGGNRNPI